MDHAHQGSSPCRRTSPAAVGLKITFGMLRPGIRKQRIQVIVLHGGRDAIDNTAHVVAGYVTRLTGLRHIATFRCTSVLSFASYLLPAFRASGLGDASQDVMASSASGFGVDEPGAEASGQEDVRIDTGHRGNGKYHAHRDNKTAGREREHVIDKTRGLVHTKSGNGAHSNRNRRSPEPVHASSFSLSARVVKGSEGRSSFPAVHRPLRSLRASVPPCLRGNFF